MPAADGSTKSVDTSVGPTSKKLDQAAENFAVKVSVDECTASVDLCVCVCWRVFLTHLLTLDVNALRGPLVTHTHTAKQKRCRRVEQTEEEAVKRRRRRRGIDRHRKRRLETRTRRDRRMKVQHANERSQRNNKPTQRMLSFWLSSSLFWLCLVGAVPINVNGNATRVHVRAHRATDRRGGARRADREIVRFFLQELQVSPTLVALELATVTCGNGVKCDIHSPCVLCNDAGRVFLVWAWDLVWFGLVWFGLLVVVSLLTHWL